MGMATALNSREPLTEAEQKEYAEWQAKVDARTPEEIEADGIKASAKITQARKEFLFRDAFMGFIICKMQMVWKEEVGTMGVTVTECTILCYYNSAWVLKLTTEELMGVLEHEALHVLNKHMARRASRQPLPWNVACDMAINCIIKLPLPRPGAFVPLDKDEWLGKSGEYIYNELPRPEEGEDGEGEGEGEGPDGEGEGKGQGKDGKGKDKKGKGKPKGYGKFKTFDNHDVWKEADHAGLVDALVKQMVQEALARNKGMYPGQYETIVSTILKTTCDWRALLRFYVTSRVRSNRKISYKHRDRRRITASEFAFPGHVRKEGLDVIVVCDTSGSMMNKKDMEQFFSELEGIIRQTNAQTRLIQIDADVQSDEVYKKGDWQKIKVKGGGGTDFRPCFTHIEKKKYKPCVVIFYTDGYGDFPEVKDAPKYQVLWTMITDVKAPFGKTIKLDLD